MSTSLSIPPMFSPCTVCGKETKRIETDVPRGFWYDCCTDHDCKGSKAAWHYFGDEIEEVRSNPYEPPVYDPVLNDLQRAHQERNNDRLALSNY